MKRARKNGRRSGLNCSRYEHLCLLGALSAASLGCASTSQAPALVRSASDAERRPAPNAGFPDGPPRRLDRLTLPVDIAVPAPEAWQQKSQRDSMRLTHAPTNTVIELRHWTTRRLATAPQCEEELALRTPEFARRRHDYRDSEAMTTRPFSPGAEHEGELTAKVVGAPDATRTAWVHGVAVGLGRCLTFDAETMVNGTNGEAELAKRVAVLLDEIAASIRLRRVEERGDTTYGDR